MGHETVSRPTRLPGRKNLIAGVAATVAAGAIPVAHADIELGSGFSITGFADMSFWSANPSDGPTSKGAGIDQFETDFKWAGSAGISAQVDVEYGANWDGTPGDTTFVEQAFLTKSFSDQFSIKFGRFLSYSGWEAEEPTGLFQYSGTGYGGLFYGYYQQGVSAKYDTGKFAFMASVVDNTFDPPSYGNSFDKLGYEVGVAVTPVEGLTAKLFYMADKDSSQGDKDVINFWVSYAFNGFTFAGEYNDADYKYDDGEFSYDEKGDGYLLMANYASGPAGITLRYHNYDAFGSKTHGFTVSPSVKVGDNLLLVAEYRKDKFTGGDKLSTVALEALFTF